MAPLWRLLFLITAVVAKKKGVQVRNKEKVKLDEALLPDLKEVLAKLDLDATELLALGIETTRQFVSWGRSDVNIHGTDMGWDRDRQKVINAKILSIREHAAKAKKIDHVDPLHELRRERNALTYGRVFVKRSTASFEFKKAWFGASFPEDREMALVRALPVDGCAPLMFQNTSLYKGSAVLADRGGCSFVDKAWHAHNAGASLLLVINNPDTPFDRPTAGYATDAEPTPSPDALAVGLVHQDAGPALVRAASSVWAAHGDSAVELTQTRAPWRAFLEAHGLLKKSVVVDRRQGPWDVRDATTVRAVPLKCVPGRPDCSPVLESEKKVLPDTDSGSLVVDDESFEFVSAAWGGVLPDRPLTIVVATPEHLCAEPPHWVCRTLSLLCPGPNYPAFYAKAAGALVVAKRGGGCAFAVKARHAASLGAAVLVVEQRDEEPLLRMGARAPPFPQVVGVAVRSKAGRALRAGGVASLRAAEAPGFAHRWLELAESAPWPVDAGNAGKLLASVVEKNAGSAERLAFAWAAHAGRATELAARGEL